MKIEKELSKNAARKQTKQEPESPLVKNLASDHQQRIISHKRKEIQRKSQKQQYQKRLTMKVLKVRSEDLASIMKFLELKLLKNKISKEAVL